MEDIHIYLDEKYSDHKAPHALQVTALTGVALTSSQLVPFRHRYFDLLNDLFPSSPRHIPGLIEVHASKLFPDREDDAIRFQFMDGLVSIANDMKLRILRIGYRRNSDLQKLFSRDTAPWGNYHGFERIGVLSLCFSGFQRVHDTCESLVFYHMERDNSEQQYHTFQGTTTYNQWFSRILPPESMSINMDSVGDVSFYAKGSPYGVLPDCMGYLLHLRWRSDRSDSLSQYQLQMVGICNSIEAELIEEYIVDMELLSPDM